MKKLKVITLTIARHPEGNYEYKAIDIDGRVIATRTECLAANGKTYIVALLIKNMNNLRAHSMHMMTTYKGIKSVQVNSYRTVEGKRKPYAYAVLEEHKEEFTKWLQGQ